MKKANVGVNQPSVHGVVALDSKERPLERQRDREQYERDVLCTLEVLSAGYRIVDDTREVQWYEHRDTEAMARGVWRREGRPPFPGPFIVPQVGKGGTRRVEEIDVDRSVHRKILKAFVRTAPTAKEVLNFASEFGLLGRNMVSVSFKDDGLDRTLVGECLTDWYDLLVTVRQLHKIGMAALGEHPDVKKFETLTEWDGSAVKPRVPSNGVPSGYRSYALDLAVARMDESPKSMSFSELRGVGRTMLINAVNPELVEGTSAAYSLVSEAYQVAAKDLRGLLYYALAAKVLGAPYQWRACRWCGEPIDPEAPFGTEHCDDNCSQKRRRSEGRDPGNDAAE
ncbi:MAG: hypothetical protein JSS66_09225 [Armatimonadetes bacterium]|nr:hypothetical protein [Armatimonadota bacterium]